MWAFGISASGEAYTCCTCFTNHMQMQAKIMNIKYGISDSEKSAWVTVFCAEGENNFVDIFRAQAPSAT